MWISYAHFMWINSSYVTVVVLRCGNGDNLSTIGVENFFEAYPFVDKRITCGKPVDKIYHRDI